MVRKRKSYSDRSGSTGGIGPVDEEFDALSSESQAKRFDFEELEYIYRRGLVERYFQDSEARKNLAGWAKWVVSAWLGAIFILVVLSHIPALDWLALSDSVTIVLLGTTTLNVLGLMFIVLYGYFPKSSKEALREIRQQDI
jgi:hypothetical protein